MNIQIALTIISETPLRLGAGGAGRLSDTSILRDARGRPIIPGSHVKGKTRHALEALLRGLGIDMPEGFDDETDTIIRQLFGSPNRRSRLCFADLHGGVGTSADDFSWPKIAPIRPAVAINRRRGTAEAERLVFQETAHAGMHFTAEQAITGSVDDVGDAALLWAALRLTTRWGGGTSRGLGWSRVEARVYLDGQVVEHPDLQAHLSSLLSGEGATNAGAA